MSFYHSAALAAALFWAGGVNAASVVVAGNILPALPSPVAQWSFDSGTITGTSVTDVTGHGNTGTIFGTASQTTGFLGQAMSFDGTTGYVDAGTPADLNLTGPYTLHAWIKPNAVSNWNTVVGKEATAGGGYAMWLRGNGPLGCGQNHGSNTIASTGQVPLGQWTAVDCVFTGSGLQIYINGQPSGSGGSSQPPGTTTGPVRIAKSIAGAFFSGLIDDVRIYNSALTASNILALYNSASGPKAAATLTAPTPINFGQSSTLTWTSANATSCTGTGFSTGNATSGTVSVSPSVTTTYSVNCSGATASTTVTVQNSPTASLSANPTSITTGGSSTLTWSSANATSCTGTNFSTGNATSGTASVSPSATTNYSVNCLGAVANTTVAMGATGDPTVGLLPSIRDGYASWSTAGLRAIPFTGVISGTTLTVTTSLSGALGPGQVIAGAGIAGGTQITALGSGTGGPGNYTVNNSQSTSSGPMTATGIPNRTTISATLSACSPNGSTACDDTPAINNALNNCLPGQVVLLNKGVFQINGNGLIFSSNSCTLRGSGVGSQLSTGINGVTVSNANTPGTFTVDPNATQLIKADRATNFGYPILSFYPLGVFLTTSTNLAADAVKDTNTLTLVSAPSTPINVGDIVYIDEDTSSDPDITYTQAFINTDGATYSTGWFTLGRQRRSKNQLMEVVGVSNGGKTLTFDTPFHITFATTQTAQLTQWGGPFLHGAGVENLFLFGGKGGDSGGNIAMSDCAYCWVANVESAWTGGGSVAFTSTFRSVLRDSFMHETPGAQPGVVDTNPALTPVRRIIFLRTISCGTATKRLSCAALVAATSLPTTIWMTPSATHIPTPQKPE
jgi:hypothetical protein